MKKEKEERHLAKVERDVKMYMQANQQ